MAFSEKLFRRLQHAYHVVVLTGAGISAASGVPTFRGKEGLWRNFRAEELANLNAFLDNPELVWEWYNWRRDLIRNVRPNLGHYALVDIERFFPEFALVTQNVDNLHREAGTKKIIELHGNIMRNIGIDCKEPSSCDFDMDATTADGQKVPMCKTCGSLVRPGVVWFGEMLPETVLEAAQQRSAEAEVFISIGTSSVVEPAASLPYLAKGNGAYLLEINPEETPLSRVADERISAPADKVLPLLALAIERIRQKVR